MRLSRLLGRTFRQPPAEAQLASHQLLVRAGFVRALEGGHFAWLPLGRLALARLQSLVQHGLMGLNGQEVELPLAVPSLPADPEGVLVWLVGHEVDSYRQLPLLLLQMTALGVSSSGSRAGLFGAAERPFATLSAFGSARLGDLEPRVAATLDQVFAACDLPVLWAEAGHRARWAWFAHPAGDKQVAHCPACGYAAEISRAATAWPRPPDEAQLAMEEISTPGCDTIAALAAFLEIPAARTLKMVFYSVEGKVTCVVIRGDRKVDEAKLARILGTTWYYTSLEEELAAVGAVGGYASPVGLDAQRVRVVADLSVRSGANFVSGANRPGFHISNVNVPRDFVPAEWADLALVEPGDPCPHCKAGLEVEGAFELVRSQPPIRTDAEYRDEAGQAQAVWMACWQLDLGRLLAAVVEAHHDEYGILWPVAVSPFDVHLVALDLREGAVAAKAEALYAQLQAEGVSVLYDDRDASAGVKFNDADLIGVPLRLTISKRWLADSRIEAKWRNSPERLKLDDQELAAELDKIQRERASRYPLASA